MPCCLYGRDYPCSMPVERKRPPPQPSKNGYPREGISAVGFFRKNFYCCGLLRRSASRASPARLREAAAGSGTLRAAICSALSTPW